MSSDEMEALFRKTKNHTRAAFLFCLASDLRQIPSSLHAALDHLEDCMNLLPSEASFHFFKGRWLDLWLDQGILLARALNLPVAEELAATDSVKAWVIESYERAVELEPDWDEPREKLRSLQSE
ncbi:MAG: hypothetical protein HY040_07225 [Planctomycetes bacterium]|nr:hypothetical protein [Planctomycetota bacterium]